MVAIIENWAIIVGIVLNATPAPIETGVAMVIVQIERIEPHEDYPMLLQQRPGDKIKIQLRPEQINSIADLVGTQISIRVRRGQDRNVAFAAPDERL